MNFFRRKSSHHDNDVLELTARHVSLIVAGFILFSFFVFIAGYFYGQKRAAEQFAYRLDQESLADQIYSSMCGLYDNKGEDESGEETENSNKSEEQALSDQIATEIVVATAHEEHREVPVASSAASYRAQLIGFSSKNAAQKCASMLQAKGFTVDIQERHSTNKKGTAVAWYQVVTRPYVNQEELITVVDKIKKIAHIKDARIVAA